MNDFFQRVWELVCQVPRGRVTTYGAIARRLGSAQSARMVGWAMNACHSSTQNVPAQRVVNRQGLLSGKMHFAHPNLMQELLESEGIPVREDQIQNFERFFWDEWEE